MQQSPSPVIEVVAAVVTAVVLLLVRVGSPQSCQTTLGLLSARDHQLPETEEKFMQH